MQLPLALIFIFAVVEFFFAACTAVGASFTNAARSINAVSQSVLFRVHNGVNIVSDFSGWLDWVGGDFSSGRIGKRISFEELCDVWPILSNTSYLVQYHNAGTRKNSRSVPGQSYFGKINWQVYEWALWGGGDPNASRSGRAVTRRSEIDFSFFWFMLEKKTALCSTGIVNIVFIVSTNLLIIFFLEGGSSEKMIAKRGDHSIFKWCFPNPTSSLPPL